MNAENRTKIHALLIASLLVFLSVLCLAAILLPGKNSGACTADIYQNGQLIASIDLTLVREPYSFTVTGDNDCTNTVEIRPGSIGITSADCPDKLCVHQGFISDSRIPITCLPNRLVIRLRPSDGTADPDSNAPDIIAY